jgi:proteic killer suppression protein
MIKSFRGKLAMDIYDGISSKATRRFSKELHGKADRLLDQLNAVTKLDSLRVPPGNRLEGLKGDLKGFHSLRINNQWRIIFKWIDGNAYEVDIVDYH